MTFRRIAFIASVIMVQLTETVSGQCPSSLEFNALVNELESNPGIPAPERLKKFRFLQSEFEKCKHVKDSVYAKILHRVATLEFINNGMKVTPGCIDLMLAAIRINTSGARGSDPNFAPRSFYNAARFYKSAGLNRDALKYYDSTIQFSNRYGVSALLLLQARQDRAEIFFDLGDYQQCIDEASHGYMDAQRKNQQYFMVLFLNRRSQAYDFHDIPGKAAADVDLTIQYAKELAARYEAANDTDSLKLAYNELATAYRVGVECSDTVGIKNIKGLISNGLFYRVKSGNLKEIANDYINYGSLCFRRFKDYNTAKQFYLKSIDYCKDSKVGLGYAHLNLGAVNFVQGNYAAAEKDYVRCLIDIDLNIPDIFSNATLEQINTIKENEFVHVYLNNKTEYLVSRYRQTRDTRFLKACLATSLLADSLIRSMRKEQVGEQTKLFWRTRTREFFTNALEACFLSNDPKLAFYFMESSRAVILADKLNELGASSLLPLEKNLEEQKLRSELIIQQQDLLSTAPGSKEYNESYNTLLQKREELGRFLQSLEKDYPAYYQYKYSDVTPTLDELKSHLANTRQSFVHYFIGDTVTYALGISGRDVKMVRITKDQFQREDISKFISFFADKQLLNSQYATFTNLSYRLYQTLFEPLAIRKGRVVICPDNFLLPFEALYADKSASRMLIQDYAVSYIYSAGYLLKQFPKYPAKGNFLGFAPVSFQSYLGVADLTKSATSLEDAAAHYSNTLMYTTTHASKRNFLSSIGHYNIVNIFSHARADQTDAEPILYMQDSIISLSELQYLNRPGTKLVVLSACQTTVGKNATGEGIYSLARGFASAGIPSVAATMWKADEETVYAISKLFHQYLSKGAPMDEALQNAKLQFMKNADREHLLPYYWANMVVIGKVEPLELEKAGKYKIWYIVGLTLLAILIGLISLRLRIFARPFSVK